MNLTLSGEQLQELRKTYRYLRVGRDEVDGRPILQATKAVQLRGRRASELIKWDTIPVLEPSERDRTVVQIYPNRIWDIEELL